MDTWDNVCCATSPSVSHLSLREEVVLNDASHSTKKQDLVILNHLEVDFGAQQGTKVLSLEGFVSVTVLGIMHLVGGDGVGLDDLQRSVPFNPYRSVIL